MKTSVNKKWIKIQKCFIASFHFEQPLLVARAQTLNTTDTNTMVDCRMIEFWSVTENNVAIEVV